MRDEFEIIHLPRDKWEGALIPMRYTAEEYFDVSIENGRDHYSIKLNKCRFDVPVCHYPEEYDFPDRLYQQHWEKAFAWGIVRERGEGQEMIACIETCPEEWSNRLIVTELWVHEEFRRKGIAHALMAVAKEQAALEHRRAIILETQSCNVSAIRFYQEEGFEIIGMDSCCYSNRDIERKEVRINLGYFPRKQHIFTKDQIVVRREEEYERHEVEEVCMRAFWNKYHMGCGEHLLVHKMWDNDAYVPQLSRVACVGDAIVGFICYAKAKLRAGDREKEILTFGPLCVAPGWQGCGIGGVLLEKTLTYAKDVGWEGVVIFGEPDYYPRYGFQTCDKFGITTRDGKNYDSFLGIELVEGGLSEFGGSFHVPAVYGDLSEKETEQFTKQFSAPPRQKFPCQWD